MLVAQSWRWGWGWRKGAAWLAVCAFVCSAVTCGAAKTAMAQTEATANVAPDDASGLREGSGEKTPIDPDADNEAEPAAPPIAAVPSFLEAVTWSVSGAVIGAVTTTVVVMVLAAAMMGTVVLSPPPTIGFILAGLIAALALSASATVSAGSGLGAATSAALVGDVEDFFPAALGAFPGVVLGAIGAVFLVTGIAAFVYGFGNIASGAGASWEVPLAAAGLMLGSSSLLFAPMIAIGGASMTSVIATMRPQSGETE